MGGHIAISSTPGVGSIFSFEVPVGVPNSALYSTALETPRVRGEEVVAIDIALQPHSPGGTQPANSPLSQRGQQQQQQRAGEGTSIDLALKSQTTAVLAACRGGGRGASHFLLEEGLSPASRSGGRSDGAVCEGEAVAGLTTSTASPSPSPSSGSGATVDPAVIHLLSSSNSSSSSGISGASSHRSGGRFSFGRSEAQGCGVPQVAELPILGGGEAAVHLAASAFDRGSNAGGNGIATVSGGHTTEEEDAAARQIAVFSSVSVVGEGQYGLTSGSAVEAGGLGSMSSIVADSTTPAACSATGNSISSSSSGGGACAILLAEDSPVVVRIVMAQLKRCGYTDVTAVGELLLCQTRCWVLLVMTTQLGW